ncbi:LAME_0G18228g1_1 [Lachancea meyersii CBS 8951]|uniref:LAME_0G18228g1_1 n=1 Tax=Lachancea meyersii CBS 8951 TaxID=1266667 RepID=A0A1G4KBR8_9SACH|nr:LAME_0G18228g1_1 [Lachancea meyersii CBS 8951]
MASFQPVFLCALVLRALRFCIADDSQGSLPSLRVNKDASGLYYINASVGTPGQMQMLRVDVVQPYTWLLAKQFGSVLFEEEGVAEGSTFYNSDDSSTALNISNGQISEFAFMDRISFNSSAYSDTLELVSVDQIGTSSSSEASNGTVNWRTNSSSLWFQDYAFFGATEATYGLLQGALGLGGKINYPGNVVDSSQYNRSYYFLDQMASNGLINSSSYSLWMGGDTVNPISFFEGLENCGKLILGGVDRSLYTGDFVKFDTLPFVNSSSGFSSRGYPIIPLNKVSVRNSAGHVLNLTSDYFLEPVLLDSRYRYSFLPLSLIIQIAVQANAYYVESLDRWLLACDVASMDASILFQFGNLIINVPLRDLMGPTYDPATNDSLHFSNSQPACELRLLPETNIGLSILGGSFIKNVYLAAELESHQIALAQASTLPRITTETTSSTSSTSTSLSSHTSFSDASFYTSGQSHIEHRAVSTAEDASAIKSGVIPFATSNNYSSYETLVLYASTAEPAASCSLVNQFTATISSDGVIFTGKVLYNTSYTTGTTSTFSRRRHHNSAIKTASLSSRTWNKTCAYLTLIPLVITATMVLSI